MACIESKSLRALSTMPGPSLLAGFLPSRDPKLLASASGVEPRPHRAGMRRTSIHRHGSPSRKSVSFLRSIASVFVLVLAACGGTTEPADPVAAAIRDALPISWLTSSIPSLISQTYGERRDESVDHHAGIDIPVGDGSPVRAVANGWLVEIREDGDGDQGFGNTVVVGHSLDGFVGVTYTQYSHLQSVDERLRTESRRCPRAPQSRVSARCTDRATPLSRSDRIGLSGHSGGAATLPHLHLELKARADLGRGYTAVYPDDDPIGYRDPIRALFQIEKIARVEAVQSPAYQFRFGPQFLPGGSTTGEFRAVATAPTGLLLQVSAQVQGAGCSGYWMQARRVDGQYVTDDRERRNGEVGRGELRDPWICSDAVRSTPPQVLVASSQDNLAPTDIYAIDPNGITQDRLLGTVRMGNEVRPSLFDIAIDREGELWGISSDRLYQVDLGTLVASDRGSLNLSLRVANALAVSPTGRMILATLDGTIREVNTSNASTRQLGSLGSGFGSDGDIGFSADGRFYVSSTSVTSSVLFVLELEPFSARRIDPGHSSGFSRVFGLASADGVMYGFTTNPMNPAAGQVIRLSTSTGEGILVRNLGFPVVGATEARFVR